MTVEERITRLEVKNEQLETLVNGLVSARAKDKFYTDADINGTRQSVANITPTTFTKTAYYGESEKTFYDVPEGNTSVFFSKYNGSYSLNRIGKDLKLTFEQLVEPTDITISIQ